MQSKILDRSEEHLWEEFIKDHPLSTIHQLPKWGHFQSKIPNRGKYWIITLVDETKPKGHQIIGGSLIVRHSLPRGYSWLYAPRGPLVDYKDPNQLKAFVDAIHDIARAEKSVFLRIDPPLGPNASAQGLSGFKNTQYGFQPEHTIMLDLNESEEEILAQMKPKGRYNIRLAEKKGVQIRKANPEDPETFGKELNAFYEILQETTKRDGFHSHDQEYYQKMLLNLTDNATLYLAHYQEKAIAAVIVTYYNDTATYYYGASGNQDRNLMAPYLLHWQIIKDAKALGYKKYDLFGVAPPNVENHPWQGVTEFKNKFGGHYHSYMPAHEYPFKKVIYPIYTLYKKIKK